jgi:peptidoglycan L-alanyl-D-glutamate endopeptidase CwlK
MKHTNDGDCQRCKEFLKDAHSDLAIWFRDEQINDATLHVSESFRNKVDQEEDFAKGVSRAHFGQSAHNYRPAMGLDCFYLDAHGVAAWPIEKFKAMAARAPDWIEWGGSWKSIKDNPHFDIKGWEQKVKNYPHGNP